MDNFWSAASQLLANFLSTFCQLLVNFLSTLRQPLVNFWSTFGQCSTGQVFQRLHQSLTQRVAPNRPRPTMTLVKMAGMKIMVVEVVVKKWQRWKLSQNWKKVAPWIIPPLTSQPPQRVSGLTPAIDNLQRRPRRKNYGGVWVGLLYEKRIPNYLYWKVLEESGWWILELLPICTAEFHKNPKGGHTRRPELRIQMRVSRIPLMELHIRCCRKGEFKSKIKTEYN